MVEEKTKNIPDTAYFSYFFICGANKAEVDEIHKAITEITDKRHAEAGKCYEKGVDVQSCKGAMPAIEYAMIPTSVIVMRLADECEKAKP
jgi:hypothetical protein